jgi:flagellar biosynthetic protein FliR
MNGVVTFYLADFFHYAVVLGRFGGLIAFLPGIGETFIPGRIKALLAFAFTLGVTPIIDLSSFAFPRSPLDMALVLCGEVLVGYFLASLVRLMIAAADMAGALLGFQTGLANIFTINVASAQQTDLISAVLGLFMLMLIFVTDLHLLFLRTLVESYHLLQPGFLREVHTISVDLLAVTITVFSKSLWLSIQLAAPMMAVSVMIALASGLINRLLPQIYIFFMIQPVQIAVGLIVFFLTVAISLPLVHDALEALFTSSFWTKEQP